MNFFDSASNFNKTTLLVDVNYKLKKFITTFEFEYYNNKNLEKEYNKQYIISIKGYYPYTYREISFHILRNKFTGYIVLWVEKSVIQEHIDYFIDPKNWDNLFKNKI